MVPELLKTYKTIAVPFLKQKFGYKNVMQVPRVEKVTLNIGYGRMVKDTAFIERITQTLSLISGQKPVHQKAKKSISNFKTRQGMNIAASVTLRGPAMYEFLYRFVHLTLPRIRDFRGLNPKSFDRQGNYTIGFKEQIAFPEVQGDAADKIHGLEVVITTSAKNREEGHALLSSLGFPFRDK